jgi:cytochrome P450
MTAPQARFAEELFDPYSAAIREDPYPVYRVLRDEHPLYRNDSRGFWALSRYDDVAAALADHETFSSEGSLAVGGVDVSAFLPMMIMMDPPRHDHLRALVSRAFTPRHVLALEPTIQSVAAVMVDRLVEEGGDLVEDLAGPLPIAVMAQLLGISDAEADEVRR